jgi:hypothetical protein
MSDTASTSSDGSVIRYRTHLHNTVYDVFEKRGWIPSEKYVVVLKDATIL